jgi:hypothetical protein
VPCAGGAQERPWWRARWIEQLRGMRTRIRDKLAAMRARKSGAAPAAPVLTEAERQAEEALEAELRRRRVEEQLSGLQQRAQRKRNRRRPPGSAAPPNW